LRILTVSVVSLPAVLTVLQSFAFGHFIPRFAAKMGVFRQRRFAVIRQLLLAASMGGFLAGTVGVPIVLIDGNHKDRSQPYPCMDHPCGCRSAEACWRGCCCFTMAQKLVWAKAHGVMPPAFVVAAAKSEAKITSCRKSNSTCCDTHDHSSAPDHGSDIAPAPEVEPKNSGFQVVLVLAEDSRRCHGLAPLWFLLGAAMPTPYLECSIDLLPTGEVTVFSPKLASLSVRPDVPPPRSI
jgi:hypothetical protein